MTKITQLLHKAQKSRFWLWYLNRVLLRAIPFNAPHGFLISKINEEQIVVATPFRRCNFNHIKGIHACALATSGELVSGLYLLMHFSPQTYRIIMSKLQVDYTYQAKTQVYSSVHAKAGMIQTVSDELANCDKSFIQLVSQIHDADNNEIARVTTTWQIKKWHAVKTKKHG